MYAVIIFARLAMGTGELEADGDDVRIGPVPMAVAACPLAGHGRASLPGTVTGAGPTTVADCPGGDRTNCTTRRTTTTTTTTSSVQPTLRNGVRPHLLPVPGWCPVLADGVEWDGGYLG